MCVHVCVCVCVCVFVELEEIADHTPFPSSVLRPLSVTSTPARAGEKTEVSRTWSESSQLDVKVLLQV